MATFYIDFENGNDANDGLSFANRWKTITNGATAARIAPGDTIRVMASPNPTTVGNATWTSSTFANTVATITSASNTSPIVITTSADHGLVTGDYVSILAAGTNGGALGTWKVGTTTNVTFQILQMDGSNTTGTAAGTSGTFRKVNNCIVKLATPVNQNIAVCGSSPQAPSWTASANVTTGLAASNMEGGAATRVNVGASFTTGKAAYLTLPATLNLSGYQQVCFWIYQASGTLGAANSTYLALCSDTLGATVVNTVNIPALQSLTRWYPIVVDLGTNLGSSIQSIAFYVATDNGAQDFYLDNIVACKASSAADSITLNSLISQQVDGATEGWYAIQAINYDTLQLFGGNLQSPLNATANTTRGYDGTGGTVTTYKRETIYTPAIGSYAGNVAEGGTAGSPITFSGGWNRTDMSTQTGYTWMDGRCGSYTGLAIRGLNYVTIDRFGFTRFATAGLSAVNNGTTQSTFFTIGNVYATSSVVNTSINAQKTTIDVLNSNNGSIGIGQYTTANAVSHVSNTAAATFTGATINTLNVRNSSSLMGLTGCTIGTYTFVNSATTTTSMFNTIISGGSASGNLSTFGSTATSSVIRNFSSSDTILVNSAALTSYGSMNFARLGNTDGNNWQYWLAGTVNQQTSIVDSPATSAWKMSPTSSFNDANLPVKLKVATIVCNANSQVTVTLRMRRDNTGLTMRLICPGGQIAGVASDTYTDMTAAADTWQTVSLSFTPTKAGGVDIFVYAFGGTTYSGYVCNFTVTQA